jgi:thiamine-phosphate pyrophosphorylase
MQLILLSKPDFFIEEHQILTLLFEEGLELLHLKKPHSEPVYSERLLTLIPEKYHKNIVVHQHFYLKEEYGLKGIHLSKEETNVPKVYNGSLSCTCRTLDDIAHRKNACNYVVLSDVERFAPDSLEKAANEGLIDHKVMAEGHITPEVINKLKNYDFGGVVVGDDIWNRFDLHSVQDYKELIAHFKTLRKQAE